MAVAPPLSQGRTRSKVLIHIGYAPGKHSGRTVAAGW